MSHNTTPASPLTLSLAALGLALAFPASGCQHGQRVDQMTQAVESGERPVAMAGSEAFFAGKLTARVTVSRGIGHGFKRSNATFLHGPTGFVSTNELTNEDRANELEAKEAYDDYMRARPNIGTPLPPVTLHLILINPGSDPLKITMIDFSSELGNFVVDPDTVTVPPGGTGEPTPMVSQLGVSSDVIPVTVTLRLGATRETRTVLVRNLLDESGKPKAAP
jgi:hypothetical protein